MFSKKWDHDEVLLTTAFVPREGWDYIAKEKKKWERYVAGKK